MAHKTVVLKRIPLDGDYVGVTKAYFLGEKIMLDWLSNSDQGQWCRENLNIGKYITFEVVSNIDTYNSSVYIKANLTEEEYTYYILRFGDKIKCVNN